MIFQFNKLGESPEYYEFEEMGDGLTIFGFFTLWPFMWGLLYFNEGTEGVYFLWDDMFGGGVLNFIASNIVLFIKSFGWFFMSIFTWIFS